MPKNLGLYNDDLSTPRKQDVDACYGPDNAPPYPVTSVNKKTGAVVLDASDVNAVAKTGDSMTGTLTVGSASLETNGYVTGTWFKTTADIALTTKSSKIAVIEGGWIYSRTPEQIKDDIGLGNVVTSVNGQTGVVTLGASDIGALPLTGGIMSGIIDMNGAKITNVGTPTESQDAVNKAYADSVKGVEVLTQSVEPTTQITGDFWFQES